MGFICFTNMLRCRGRGAFLVVNNSVQIW